MHWTLVQSLVHTNRIPLLYKKNSKDYAIRNETITIVHFLLSSCDMSLHGKLVAIALCWLLKLFFLRWNDVLDAVLGTDLGEQRCFKFLIRQFVSLNKTKIICSMHDRSETVRCLWFLWCEDLTCDCLQHNKHSRRILGVHANIITAVTASK